MALKTFNINEETYKRFSEHCKKEGISMSKRIENFLKQEVEKIKQPETKGENSFSKYCH
jgi:hypothetical protein